MKDNSGEGTLTIFPQMIQSISYVHDDGELPIRGVRSEWTCAHEIRVCYGVCAAMVGMFFSLFLVFIYSRQIGSAKVVFLDGITKYFVIFL